MHRNDRRTADDLDSKGVHGGTHAIFLHLGPKLQKRGFKYKIILPRVGT